MRKNLSLIFVLILCGCSINLPIPMSSNVAYKFDMRGTANGVPFNGVAVIANAPSYDIKLESPVDISLLTITSCHRDFYADDTDKHWSKKKRGYDYVYNPAPSIEDTGSCLLRIGQYDSVHGRAVLGVLDFQTKLETLSAENDCDGRVYQSTGVSICQAKVGTYQVLRFKEPVQVSPTLDSKCRPTPDDSKMNWGYAMNPGECVVAYSSLSVPLKFHRHTTIGYTDISIRGN